MGRKIKNPGSGRESTFFQKGMQFMKDKDGNVSRESLDDPRYLSGELTAITKGMATVEDKNGKRFHVVKDDPRVKSGELHGLSKGMKLSDEHKSKISAGMQGKQDAQKNSQFGTCWVNNSKDKLNKKIKKDELDQYLKLGWLQGRKMKF